jgi:uncharacterized membrane protein
MATNKNKQGGNSNIFLKLHPLHRFIISLLLAGLCYFLVKGQLSVMATAVVLWIAFAMAYLIMTWIVLFTRSIPDIKVHANKDDGSAIYVFIMVLVSSFASLVSVLVIMINKELATSGLYLPVALGGMMFSWIMVHTLFTVHYAHLFYDNMEDDNSKSAEGLEFPGKEKPDDIDFAYFSFIIGSTFQVSDVAISSRKIRRMAMLHGLLSFVLNTFVVALTINLVAGLLNG